MRAPVRLFYLSDKSFEKLVFMAKKAGYVAWGANRLRGLSEYLSELAQLSFTDTRPPLVVERHNQEIQEHHAPTWSTRARRTHALMLTEDAIARYYLVAFQVGIMRINPSYLHGTPSRLTPTPAVSHVLEAIGKEWITPVGNVRQKES
jgi:hypothetical protein